MEAEYELLVNDVTPTDVAVERQIRVVGPDAEAFVNYVVTRDATDIKPTRYDATNNPLPMSVRSSQHETD